MSEEQLKVSEKVKILPSLQEKLKAAAPEAAIAGKKQGLRFRRHKLKSLQSSR